MRATQTLDKYPERLRETKRPNGSKFSVMSAGNAGEQFFCWLNDVPCSSLPDTGSDVNLISLGFAKTLGYYNEEGGKLINIEDPITVVWADCSENSLSGSVEIVVTFNKPS